VQCSAAKANVQLPAVNRASVGNGRASNTSIDHGASSYSNGADGSNVAVKRDA